MNHELLAKVQKEFEEFAVLHSLSVVKTGPTETTIGGMGPAKYFIDSTESAWQAWLHQERRIVASLAVYQTEGRQALHFALKSSAAQVSCQPVDPAEMKFAVVDPYCERKHAIVGRFTTERRANNWLVAVQNDWVTEDEYADCLVMPLEEALKEYGND
jgi:hypothetical protein